jgi:hypothetical protein
MTEVIGTSPTRAQIDNYAKSHEVKVIAVGARGGRFLLATWPVHYDHGTGHAANSTHSPLPPPTPTLNSLLLLSFLTPALLPKHLSAFGDRVLVELHSDRPHVKSATSWESSPPPRHFQCLTWLVLPACV